MQRKGWVVALVAMLTVLLALFSLLLNNLTGLMEGVRIASQVAATPLRLTVSEALATDPTQSLPTVTVPVVMRVTQELSETPPTPESTADSSPFTLTLDRTQLPSDGISTTNLTLTTLRDEWVGRRTTFLVRGGGTLSPMSTTLPEFDSPTVLTYTAGDVPGNIRIEASVQDQEALFTQSVSVTLTAVTSLELIGQYTTREEGGFLYTLRLSSPEETASLHSIVISVDERGRLSSGERTETVQVQSNSETQLLIQRVGPSPVSFGARISGNPEIPPLREFLYDVDNLPDRLDFAHAQLAEARLEYNTGTDFYTCLLAFTARNQLTIPPQLGFSYSPILTPTTVSDATLAIGGQILQPGHFSITMLKDTARSWTITDDQAVCWLIQPQTEMAGLYRFSTGVGPVNHRVYSTALIHRGRIRQSAGITLNLPLNDGTSISFLLPTDADLFMLSPYSTTESSEAIVSGWLANDPDEDEAMFYSALESPPVKLSRVGEGKGVWLANDKIDQPVTDTAYDGQVVFRAYLVVETQPTP